MSCYSWQYCANLPDRLAANLFKGPKKEGFSVSSNFAWSLQVMRASLRVSAATGGHQGLIGLLGLSLCSFLKLRPPRTRPQLEIFISCCRKGSLAPLPRNIKAELTAPPTSPPVPTRNVPELSRSLLHYYVKTELSIPPTPRPRLSQDVP